MLYQFLPRLADEEYEALEASILEHGVQVPVILDENGSVIDGHHRKEIADRLGIEYPKRTKTGLSDAHKRTLALTLNIDRRQLNREQKRALIAASLSADPDLSDRAHAKRTGADHKTVGSIRRDIEQVGNFPTSEPGAGQAPDATVPAPVEAPPESPRAGTVNPTTGEVLDDTVTVTEHTVTEKVKTVTGLDGKTYTQKPRAPKPVPRGDEAEQLNAEDMSKAVARALQTMSSMRNPNHRNRVITQWWPRGKDAVPPDWRALFEPKAIRDIATWLMQLAEELEGTP